jgi:hypothetical protein
MIVIDEDNGLVALQSLQNRTPLTSVTRKRRDTLILPVQFLKDGKTRELANGSTGILGIKEPNKFSEGFMAADLAWTKEGAGQNAVYYFAASLNSLPIEAKFTGDTIAEVKLQLELTWTEEGEDQTTTNDISLVVKNRYTQGDETAPTAPAPNLAGWGNTAFRFGVTGEPEFYNPTLDVWARMTFAGNPPQPIWTQV